MVSDLGRKWPPRPRAPRRLGMSPARLRSPIPQELVSSQWDNRSSACAQPDTCVVRLAVEPLLLMCTRDDEITSSSISQSFLRRSGPTDPSICMCTCAAFPTVCQACARASQCTVQPCIYVRVALRSIHAGWVRPGVAKLKQEKGAPPKSIIMCNPPWGGARAAALAHHNPPCHPSLHLCCRPRPRCRHHHHHHRRRRPYLVVIAAIAATAIASASGARRGASGARQGHVRGEASAARRGVWTSVDQRGSM